MPGSFGGGLGEPYDLCMVVWRDADHDFLRPDLFELGRSPTWSLLGHNVTVANTVDTVNYFIELRVEYN